MTSPRITTLENGLRVISEDMPHLETAAVGVWVDAGARNEGRAANGISHLLEHMAFKGTQRRSAQAIAEEIENVGGHINAYTSREQTAYFARVLKDDVALAIDIIADILQYSTFDAEELSREQAVVIQEIGQTRDTPDDVVFDNFQEKAFPDQPVGRSILGTPEGVSGFRREALISYMSDHYRGPRMVLSAAGRVDHDALVTQAEDVFAGLPSDGNCAREPARYEGGEHREERELEQVHFVAGFGGISYDDPDYYVSQVFSSILGGGMSSRLFQEIREKRGLCYAIYSFVSSYVDGGLFGIYAGTGEAEVPELIPAICEETMKILAHVEEDEVVRARAQLKAGLMMSLESPSSRCEQFARQLLIYGRPLPVSEIIEKVEAVDAAALRRFAERILGGSAPTIAAIGPIGRLESYDTFAARFGGRAPV